MTKKKLEYIDDEYDEYEILKYISSTTNTISAGNLAAAHEVMYRESLPLLPQFPQLSKKHEESNTENLTDQEFNARLAEANIFNISNKNNNLVNQNSFNELKKIASSNKIPKVNVDSIKKWFQENISFIKQVLMIKLLQLRNGYGEQLDRDMDESTYTSTIISQDFELLKLYFPKTFTSMCQIAQRKIFKNRPKNLSTGQFEKKNNASDSSDSDFILLDEIYSSDSSVNISYTDACT
nr:2866_t:CDS:2 [Entrophospora candida]